MSTTWELLIIFGLILANGFFAAAEIAILTARRSRLEARANAGNRSARAALELAQTPDQFLPTVQVGITLVGTLASVFGGARIVRYLTESMERLPGGVLFEYRATIAMSAVVVGISFLSLVFGELVPKRLALAHAERLAALAAIPMKQLARIVRPIVWLLGIVTQAMLVVLRSRRPGKATVSVEDIEYLIRAGMREGVLEPAEHMVARRALRLGDRAVRDIMRPRLEIDAIEVSTPPEEVVGAFAMAGFSRLPIYEGHLDNILGFVYAKDLLHQQHMQRPINLRKLLRRAVFVPETLAIDRLLGLFRENRTQMAIVLDEYGGTEGLVTLEDVLEELVGEIHDEHRQDTQQEIVKRDERSWLIDAGVNLDDLLERLGLAHLRTHVPRELATVGGLVFSLLNRLPRVGDRVAWKGLTMEVVDMDGRRIDRLLITLEPEAGSPSS